MKICGIYSIENIINGKMYIGSSVDCYGRFRSHKSCLSRNTHQNPHLQSAWNKYGENIFRFGIILKCDICDLDKLEIELIKRHKLDNRDFGYNLDLGGKGTNRIVSKETRKKLSLFHTGKPLSKLTRQKISQTNSGKNHRFYGKRHNAKTIEKISASLKNLYKDKTKNPMYGKRHTDETKRKIRKSMEKYRGKDHPRYGKKHTAESLLKMGKSHFGKIPGRETREKMSRARKGKKFSEEHRKHLSESAIRSHPMGKENPLYGKHLSEETKKKMSVGRTIAWCRKKRN